MNMIPQNFINVLKNEIKNVINDKVDVFIDTIADVFNSNNSLDKYTNVFITADRTTKELILSIIKTLLENIDNHFKCSEVRIKNYVVNKIQENDNKIREYECEIYNIENKKQDSDKSLMEKIEKFLSMDNPDRNLTASLIDRIEITEDNNIDIYYKFKLV